MPVQKVLTGILYVLSEGCTWRAIDSPEANWNSIYGYYRRWCAEGVWEQIWSVIAPTLHLERCYIDATHIKVAGCAANPAGGSETEAMGRSKGGLTSKVHAAVDVRGCLATLFLSAGNVSDIVHADTLLEEIHPEMVVADRAYDSDRFRSALIERGIKPCIPPRRTTLHPMPYSRNAHATRHRVENYFGALKTFRRVATRFDKLAENYLGWVWLATIIKCAF